MCHTAIPATLPCVISHPCPTSLCRTPEQRTRRRSGSGSGGSGSDCGLLAAGAAQAVAAAAWNRRRQGPPRVSRGGFARIRLAASGLDVVTSAQSLRCSSKVAHRQLRISSTPKVTSAQSLRWSRHSCRLASTRDPWSPWTAQSRSLPDILDPPLRDTLVTRTRLQQARPSTGPVGPSKVAVAVRLSHYAARYRPRQYATAAQGRSRRPSPVRPVSRPCGRSRRLAATHIKTKRRDEAP